MGSFWYVGRMKHLTLLMLLSIVNSFSWADQRPTSGLIYGMTTNDGLLYQCASVSESIIQCDFSQIKVRKSTTREKVIEQGKSALDEWSTPEAKRSREKRFTKEKCDEIKNSIAAAETEKVHSEVKELIGQEQLQDNPDYKNYGRRNS